MIPLMKNISETGVIRETLGWLLWHHYHANGLCAESLFQRETSCCFVWVRMCLLYIWFVSGTHGESVNVDPAWSRNRAFTGIHHGWDEANEKTTTRTEVENLFVFLLTKTWFQTLITSSDRPLHHSQTKELSKDTPGSHSKRYRSAATAGLSMSL